MFGWRRPNRPPKVAEETLPSTWEMPSFAKDERPDHPTPKPLDAFGIPMRQHVARGGLDLGLAVAHHLCLGFPEVAAGLVGMGYRLAAGLFTASEVGAPTSVSGSSSSPSVRETNWPTPRQRQRDPADEADAIAGSGSARDEPRNDGGDVADADGERRLKAERW